MRKLIPSLLVLVVVLFYAGSAGAAVAPYYGAVSGFLTGATSKDRAAPPPTPPTSPTAYARTPAMPAATVATQASPTLLSSAITVPTPPSAPAAPTARATRVRATATAKTPVPKGTAVPTLTPRQLAAEVQHIRSTKVPQGRTNILILGSDNDQKFSNYSNPLTQVVIVLSLDNLRHTITLLSISRDLWVRIPGYKYNVGPDGTVGWAKMDVASKPSAKLNFDSAACTVETDFGIPIDNWVWVGLSGFRNVIDTLHGATLDVTHPVMDNSYPDDLDPNGNAYTYRRIYIPPGPQHLDGDAALHFVRSRHGDVQGDFGRSDRQQILIDQLRRSFEGQDSAALVQLLPQLLHDFSNNVRTDSSIDFETALRYLKLFQELEHDKPIRLTLSPPYSYGQTTADSDPDVERETGNYPNYESALAPNWDAINPAIQQLFGGQVQHVSQMPNNYCARVPGVTP